MNHAYPPGRESQSPSTDQIPSHEGMSARLLRQKVRDPENNRHVQEDLRAIYSEIGFQGREAWKSAPAVFDEHSLKILNHPVMEDWEKPYMSALADIAAQRGGQILEIGFGMGISAAFIAGKPNIRRHIIIEANGDVAARAREFAATIGSHRVEVLEGLWEEVIDHIPDGSCDGILFDAYPLDESEVMNQAHFARVAYQKLRTGGSFTYFSDEVNAYRPEHLRTLTDAGFHESGISYKVVSVEPPEDCLYWKSPTILAPILVK